MESKNRYQDFKVSLSMTMSNEMRRECFKLGISRQTFIRALIRDYFIRNHGIDIDLQRKERVVAAPPPTTPSNDFSEEDFVL